jgi:3-hydroxyisobutyrate dehydrogenase
MTDSHPPLGFIGLGIMGQGMAKNLLTAGFSVTIWNRSPDRMNALIEAGAQVANGPAGVAEASDIVFVCVSDTPDVEDVVLGEGGVLQGARPGALVVDMSTIAPRAPR